MSYRICVVTNNSIRVNAYVDKMREGVRRMRRNSCSISITFHSLSAISLDCYVVGNCRKKLKLNAFVIDNCHSNSMGDKFVNFSNFTNDETGENWLKGKCFSISFSSGRDWVQEWQQDFILYASVSIRFHSSSSDAFCNSHKLTSFRSII